MRSVDISANTDETTDVNTNRKIYLPILILYGISDAKSSDSITPRVANADSHSDTE